MVWGSGRIRQSTVLGKSVRSRNQVDHGLEVRSPAPNLYTTSPGRRGTGAVVGLVLHLNGNGRLSGWM